MYAFGCVFLLLLLVAISVIGQFLSIIFRGLENIGAGCVWLWESFLNFFRREKKEVINPFTGESNFDNARQDDEYQYQPTEQRPKRYDSSDGEVTEFTEVLDNDNE